MTSTSDLRKHSKDLTAQLLELDALLDLVSGSTAGTEDSTVIAIRSQAILDSLARIQENLIEDADGGPKAIMDQEAAFRTVAVAEAELPLESALMVLAEVPQLLEKAANAQPPSNAVVLVPVNLAYRHCLEALMPLAAAVDPRQLQRAEA
jgi:hypothetical protein